MPVLYTLVQRALRRLVHRGVQQPDRRSDEHAILHRLQHIQRFLVGVFAMIDHVDAAAHGTLHRFGGAAMRIDHAVEIARHRDAGADFFLAHHRTRQGTGARVVVA